MAKKDNEYVGYLANILKQVGHPEVKDADSLDSHASDVQLSRYLRISRDAINAASWLKRYVEALQQDSGMQDNEGEE